MKIFLNRFCDQSQTVNLDEGLLYICIFIFYSFLLICFSQFVLHIFEKYSVFFFCYPSHHYTHFSQLMSYFVPNSDTSHIQTFTLLENAFSPIDLPCRTISDLAKCHIIPHSASTKRSFFLLTFFINFLKDAFSNISRFFLPKNMLVLWKIFTFNCNALKNPHEKKKIPNGNHKI